MSDPVKVIPDGYHSVNTAMIVRDGEALIDFLRSAFEARLLFRLDRPDGTLNHAELALGDSVVMVSQASGDDPLFPALLHLYLPDVDAAYQRALAAGATSLREPTEMAYGDREAGLQDANGNQFWIATHIEDVSVEEFTRRMEAQAG